MTHQNDSRKGIHLPRKTMRTLTLDVCSDFHDDWLETTASVEERTRVLAFACSLPRAFVTTNEETIRTAVTQALTSSSETRATQSQSRITELEVENAKLRTSVEAAGRDEINRICVEHQGRITEFEVENAKLRVSVETAGRDEINRIHVDHRSEMDRMRDLYQTLSEKKVLSEGTLSSRIDEHASEIIRVTRENASLQHTISELKTPAGRGRAGEIVLSDILFNAGFDIQDTSMGAKKDEGYMDLLITPRGYPSVRIAVECKNRERIDTEHIVHFEQLTRDGITKGLFESAIFVSIRANTKKEGGVHHVHMIEDSNGHSTIPVSFLGTERGRDAVPLTQDVIQAHVCMHATMMMRFSDLRRTLVSTSDTDDGGDTRLFHDTLHSDMYSMLDDLNVQGRAISTMQASMKSSRIRIINLFARLCDTQRRTGLETRDPVWMPEFRLVRDKVSTGMTDAVIWKNLSEPQKKRVADHLGGRETFLKAARTGVSLEGGETVDEQ